MTARRRSACTHVYVRQVPRAVPVAVREEPRRHEGHYFDLVAAIGAHDVEVDFTRFREDEASGRFDPR